MDKNKEVYLLHTKRKIKQAKDNTLSPMEIDLFSRIEKCIEILEYENGQLDYMVEKYMDYHWENIMQKRKKN